MAARKSPIERARKLLDEAIQMQKPPSRTKRIAQAWSLLDNSSDEGDPELRTAISQAARSIIESALETIESRGRTRLSESDHHAAQLVAANRVIEQLAEMLEPLQSLPAFKESIEIATNVMNAWNDQAALSQTSISNLMAGERKNLPLTPEGPFPIELVGATEAAVVSLRELILKESPYGAVRAGDAVEAFLQCTSISCPEMERGPDSDYSAAYLIAHTFVMSHSANSRITAHSDPAVNEILWGYEWAATVDDLCCEKCQALDGKKFPKHEVPRVPLHPGCRCTLLEIFKDEN